MPRSVSIHPERKQTVEDALKRNGFLTQGDLAANIGKALSTVSNFFNAKKVAISTFEEICEALGLDKQEIQRSLQSDQEAEMIAIPDFFAYDDAWVGRENLVKDLGDRLKASCRLLILLGISGIGKTALAEKLAIDLQGWFDGNSKLLRANFDFGDKASDFVSVAFRWLGESGEKLSPENKKPEILLPMLVNYLRENRVLVLIDSLEKLLTVNDTENSSNFADKWWEKFFLNILATESCQGRIILTSQDLPVKLLVSRYNNFWHRQVLSGLSESEQIELFETTGLDINEDSADKSLLMRIGKAYQGHPLVLRVMIGEILSEPFNG